MTMACRANSSRRQDVFGSTVLGSGVGAEAWLVAALKIVGLGITQHSTTRVTRRRPAVGPANKTPGGQLLSLLGQSIPAPAVWEVVDVNEWLTEEKVLEQAQLANERALVNAKAAGLCPGTNNADGSSLLTHADFPSMS